MVNFLKLRSLPGVATLFAALLLQALALSAPASAGISDKFRPNLSGSGTVDHSAWDQLLKRFVKPDATGLNRVNYGSFKAQGHGKLKSYIKSLERTNVRRLGRDEQFAFWANLYNAVTIDVVLDHYPVSSIKRIKLGSIFASGPWGRKLVKVSGESLSLDDIEHKILRGLFRDNRVHYAVNCASIGCPNLANSAFTGATLDTMLNKGARAYVNHPRGVKAANGRVVVSSIYKWFKKDFGGSDAGVLKHIRRYAAPGLKAKLKGINSIYDTKYNWALNDVK